MRFSLRSLLLFALLLGSAGLVWRNSDCWAPHAVIQFTSSIPGAKYVSFNYADSTSTRLNVDYKLGYKRERVQYDTSTGAQLSDEILDLPNQDLPEPVEKDGTIWADNGRYVIYGTPYNADVKDRTAGKVTHFHERRVDPLSNISATASPSVFLVKTAQYVSLRQVPGATNLVRLKPDDQRQAQLTPDRKTLVVVNGQNVQFYSTETGKLEREWDAPMEEPQMEIAADSKTLLFMSRHESLTMVCDESGREIQRFEKQGNANLTGDRNFLILESEAWQLVPKLVRTATLNPASGSRRLSNPMMQEIPAGVECVDLATGKQMWNVPDKDFGIFFQTNDKHLLHFAQRQGIVSVTIPAALFDIKTGRELFVLSPERWPSAFPHDFPILRPSEFLTVRYPTAKTPPEAIVWRQRRPVEWYGLAWLPELWLSAAFAVALIWSLFKDRRTILSRKVAKF